jgi:hypothetical protein
MCIFLPQIPLPYFCYKYYEDLNPLLFGKINILLSVCMYIHVCITYICMQTGPFHYYRLDKQCADYACLRYQGFTPTFVHSDP